MVEVAKPKVRRVDVEAGGAVELGGALRVDDVGGTGGWLVADGSFDAAAFLGMV